MQIEVEKIQIHRQKAILALTLTFFVCFLLLAVFRSAFASLNFNVNQWAASVNSGSFTAAARGISIVFDTTFIGIVSVAVAVILLLMNYKRFSLLVLSVMAGDALLVLFIKLIIMSQRPTNEILFETGYSFPSGHVTSCVVFFGVLTYFAFRRWNNLKTKAVTSGLYVATTVVVGFDRIYLNVHWLSDAIGGVFLGAFWLLLCILVFEYYDLNCHSRVLEN